MITKLALSKKVGNSQIAVLYPGAAAGTADSGIGSLGRIDQAQVPGGTTIKLHPHANDEILSYFRVGEVRHTDSGGASATLGRQQLMLMRAGSVFYHEEHIVQPLEGLQIFVRPKQANDEPSVSFMTLSPTDSHYKWRLLASDRTDSVLRFTSETAVYDMTVTDASRQSLPAVQIATPVFLLYVFQGQLLVKGSMELIKGESILTDETDVWFDTSPGTELVLFVTNPAQNCYKGGMFSGNRLG